MPHSYTKIWIHAIWATKERSPLIHLNVENKIHGHISEQLIEQECRVKIVNGMPDHVHSLFLLNPKKSIADVIKQIKGSSSHFVKSGQYHPWEICVANRICGLFCFWIGCGACISIIKNQKQHHLKKTSQQEYDEFIRLYGLNSDWWYLIPNRPTV